MRDEQTPEERVPQVQRQLASTEKAIQRLHDYIGDLETKLRPILVILSEGEGRPGTGDGMPELVRLAEALYSFEERIEIAANRILSLAERSEV